MTQTYDVKSIWIFGRTEMNYPDAYVDIYVGNHPDDHLDSSVRCVENSIMFGNFECIASGRYIYIINVTDLSLMLYMSAYEIQVFELYEISNYATVQVGP